MNNALTKGFQEAQMSGKVSGNKLLQIKKQQPKIWIAVYVINES